MHSRLRVKIAARGNNLILYSEFRVGEIINVISFFLYITGGIAGHWGEKRPKSFKITCTGASPFLTKKTLFPLVEVSRIEKTQSPKPKSYLRIKVFSRCPLFLGFVFVQELEAK